MADSKAVAAPLVPHAPLGMTDEAGVAAPGENKWCHSDVGSIMFLGTGTRPDLAFSAGALERFMSEPCEHHIVAAKRVLRYISGTRSLGLFYTGSGKDSDVLVGYSDADFIVDVYQHPPLLCAEGRHTGSQSASSTVDG